MNAPRRTTRGRLFGIAIPPFMGAVWIAGGLAALGQARIVTIPTVLLMAGLLFALGARANPERTARADWTPGARRLFRHAIAFETAGAVATLVLAQVLQRSDIVPPLIAIVVGLHFVPLARAFHRPEIYLTAVVTVAGGIVALLGWSGDMREAVAALTAGAALWMASIWVAWPGPARIRA